MLNRVPFYLIVVKSVETEKQTDQAIPINLNGRSPLIGVQFTSVLMLMMKQKEKNLYTILQYTIFLSYLYLCVHTHYTYSSISLPACLPHSITLANSSFCFYSL